MDRPGATERQEGRSLRRHRKSAYLWRVSPEGEWEPEAENWVRWARTPTVVLLPPSQPRVWWNSPDEAPVGITRVGSPNRRWADGLYARSVVTWR